MSVTILRNVDGVEVQVLKLDAVISHRIEYTSSLTEHALEDGTTVADHAIKQPHQIIVEGYVSNFPVTMLAGGILPFRDDGRGKTAYQALKELVLKTERVTVQDKLDQYTSMALIELRIPRDGRTHHGLQFTATFRHVRLVATAEVEIAEANAPIAKPAADVGVETPEESASEEEAKGSLLYRAGKYGVEFAQELF